MNFFMFDTTKELCNFEAEKIVSIIAKNPHAMICLAAGHSSLGIFDQLINLYKNKRVDFKDCKFIAMDEWQGMTFETPGSCGDLLETKFISHVNFKRENICYVNGCAENLMDECNRISDFISSNNGIDYMLLGIGMNGHLALNEPGVDFSNSVHFAELDEVTKKVGEKYFNNIDKPTLNGGITLGINDIKQAKTITLCIIGEKKSNILYNLMTSDITNMLPATAIKELSNATVICDCEAATKIFTV